MPPPVVLVLGPTASGKSEASIAIARAFGGEIVSGDAFAVYRGFDIGTAKPAPAVREEVAHHLLDVASPEETFSAGRWAAAARGAIEEIERRGRLPIVAGGSHFYIRALLGDLPEGEARDPALRRRLAAWSGERARRRKKAILDFLDPAYGVRVPPGDTQRVHRALELIFATGRRVSERVRRADEWPSRRRWLKIALQIPKEDLYTRIQVRIRNMWDQGWPEEVRRLLAGGAPPEANAWRAIGYREVRAFISGELSEAEAIDRIARRTRDFARRQRLWLAREPDLAWLPPASAVAAVGQFLGRKGESA